MNQPWESQVPNREPMKKRVRNNKRKTRKFHIIQQSAIPISLWQAITRTRRSMTRSASYSRLVPSNREKPHRRTPRTKSKSNCTITWFCWATRVSDGQRTCLVWPSLAPRYVSVVHVGIGRMGGPLPMLRSGTTCTMAYSSRRSIRWLRCAGRMRTS